MRTQAFIAATRFGLGARPGDLKNIGDDPRGWLESQLTPDVPTPRVLAGLPSSQQLVREWGRARKQGKEARKRQRAQHRELYRREVAARTTAMIRSRRPFRERLIAFWSNHFTVSSERPQAVGLVGAFEREVTRPHVCGDFSTLLLTSCRHPAMLIYLDNIRSMGPNSVRGQRRGKGLNENLAREVLELHTLGVDGGYTQADVEALARMLTGWGLTDARGQISGHFSYDATAHEPGAHTLLGHRYPSRGEGQAVAALEHLASRPATAKNVARRLARHFIADDPPRPAINKLARAFRDSGGDLAHVARTLVHLPEAWSEPLPKVKNANDYVVSAYRALGAAPEGPLLVRSLKGLRQMPFSAPSPKGWSEDGEEWVAPQSLMDRVQWAQRMARLQSPSVADPSALAEDVLGPMLSERTRRAISASTPQRGLALLLASPEFQRR